MKYGEPHTLRREVFDELEIAVYRSRDIEASVELNEISMASTRSGALTIIRGIKDKRLGLAIVDSDEPEKVKEAIEQAAKMAKLNSPDEKWVSAGAGQVQGKAEAELRAQGGFS